MTGAETGSGQRRPLNDAALWLPPYVVAQIALRARLRDPRAWRGPLVCAGIGVSNAEQAAAVARLADGVIVGTALVDRLADAGLAGLHTLTTDLATAVHTARP